ncbi:porin [Pelagibaculum spongiae]|uniref:Porin domain-containing protein n=1 Tax=Pelagibaculum spongiae TaxID=2080658 RepID=A0A2V1H7S0_9GAMM|nr:porin [Pelagibaculum spongiae]PVZ72542.1 hypothetical protein DC094_05970 [Pelagibaculum spongiae]
MRLSFAFRLSAISLAMTGLFVSTAVSAQSLEDRIRSLESQIGQMESTPGQGSGGAVEIYGSLRTFATYQSVDSDLGDDSSTDINDAASRIGIRTSTSHGDWTATARGEWAVRIGGNADFGDGRLAYVQVGHKALGKIGVGQQWGGFYNHVGAVTDIGNNGTPGGYSAIGGGFRLGNLISYTNSIGPVAIQVDNQFDGEDDTSSTSNNRDNLELYGLSASISESNCTVGVAYQERKLDDSNGSDKLAGIAVGYKFGSAYISASYVDRDNATGADPKAYDLSGSYSMGKNTLIGHYYNLDTDNAAGDKTNGVLLSVQHQMNDQLRLWTSLRLDDADTDNKETTSVDFGMRYDFSMSL